MDLSAEKAALRKEMQQRLAAADLETLAEAGFSIRRRLLASDVYCQAKTVFCYVSFRREVDTLPLLRQILLDGKTLAVPLILGPGRMEARRILSVDALIPGSFGILEPGKDTTVLSPAELDLILVPGLAFDAARYRLGRGAGYYDRYLRECPGATVALAYALQMVENLPREAHDFQLDQVLTEAACYRGPVFPGEKEN